MGKYSELFSKISDEIQLKRVHRESSTDDHRAVIVQLTNHKDKVKIIQAAPGITAEAPYGVNEQFPREITERRKQLYPYYKAAKRQGKRATMIVDKLFVEGSQKHPQRATGLETMEVSTDTQETQSNQRPNKNGNSAAPRRTPQQGGEKCEHALGKPRRTYVKRHNHARTLSHNRKRKLYVL
jgi:hypothetical protein